VEWGLKELFQFVAILACALFTGAAAYVNLVEHPARMQCGTTLASTVFGPSYRRATVMQASLALLATASALGAWWLVGSMLWIIGGLLIFAVVPFTLLVIRPTNNKLLAPDLDRAAPATHRLLVRWGRLHAVRTVASFAATVLFLVATL
jgi:uncharacterized membrane protein